MILRLPSARPLRLVGFAFLLVAMLPRLALAHAILTASTPAPGGTITGGHQTIDFQYNSKIDHQRSRLTLIGVDKVPTVLPILPGSAKNALDAVVELEPGAYTIRWQALALDGHITRGDVPFTVVAK